MMDKDPIGMPDVREFARLRTRRDFFKAMAAAGAGAAISSTVLSRKAFAQGGGGDLEIANFALTLELLFTEFYRTAVDSGVLSGEALSYLQAAGDQERQHADALTSLIKDAGGTPVEKPQSNFPDSAFASQQAVLETLSTLEPVAVGAYLGAAPLIQSPDVLAAAGSIAGVEGEHLVAVNDLLGVVPPANTAFPEALTKDQVLAAVAPFLGMDEMMDTGGVKYRDRSSFGRV